MFDLIGSRDVLLSAIAHRRKRVFMPPSQLMADEWCDTYRKVPSETSAITGQWDTSNFEIARGPMQALTEIGVRKITGMASAQIFKTTLAETAIAYFIDTQPCPILIYQPTDDTASTFVSTKLDPMIKTTPRLAALWGGKRRLEIKRDDFTTFLKKFAGGYVEIMTAQAVANLGMRSAKIVIFDELDKMKVTRDGDVVSLGEERLKGFTGEELSIRVSTPTIEGESPIAAEYAKSDQRRPYVACPHCGEFHVLKWTNVSYKNESGKADPAAAAYICEGCGFPWSESERVTTMTTKGAISWRQTRVFEHCGERQDPDVERNWSDAGRALCKTCGAEAVSNEHAGFWAWEIYHPRRTLSDLIKSWLDCQGDRGKLQNFINSKLAELWRKDEEVVVEIDVDQFISRSEPAWTTLPADVKILTMGVDVQPRGPKSPGRLEVEVVGWGDGEETWSVEYHVIEGDPDSGDVWATLDQIRTKIHETDDGRRLVVQSACVDTGGHNLDSVMAYCGPRSRQRVWAIKGSSETGMGRQPIWPLAAPSTMKHGAKLWMVGTLAAKDWVNACLGKSQPGPGYMHVPGDRHPGWHQQILNERRIVTFQRGRKGSTWRPRAEGARTEALDCRVYAKAAWEGLKRHVPTLSKVIKSASQMPAPPPVDDADQTSDQTHPQADPVTTPAPRPAPARKPKIIRKPARKSTFWG